MKRAFFAACFSVVFCMIGAALYYAVAFALIARHFSSRGFAGSFAVVTITALSVMGPFSFCMGFLGAWILPKLLFAARRIQFVSAAALLGGILGCAWPLLLDRDSRALTKDSLVFSWLPALLIGTSCAGLWAWFWSRRPVRTSGLRHARAVKL